MKSLNIGMYVCLAPLLMAGQTFADERGTNAFEVAPLRSFAGLSSQSELAAEAAARQASMSANDDALPHDSRQLQTIIFKSVRAGDAQMLAQLVRGGADINLHDETGQTPLIAAALTGESGIARLLIDNKADVRARTSNGMTALHAAAYVGNAEVAQMLITGGADVNDQANVAGITPLHAAAEEDHLAVATRLVAAGADVSRLEVNGYSAGSRAGWREHWAVVRFLLRSGDTCQSEDVAGAWLRDKCTHLNPYASN